MNLISFSLFGADPFFCIGAVRNAELAKIIYPGWKVRFYVRSDVPKSIIEKLREQGAEVIPMPIKTLTGPLGAEDAFAGTFWRFLPISEPIWDRVIIRDVDSRLNVREKAAVDEWIESGKSYHIMKDHFCHVDYRLPILAGMWGAKGGLTSLYDDLLKWIDWSGKLTDQAFLTAHVWPLAQNDKMEHGPEGLPFKVELPKHQFVGEYVDEFEKHWGQQNPLELSPK